MYIVRDVPSTCVLARRVLAKGPKHEWILKDWSSFGSLDKTTIGQKFLENSKLELSSYSFISWILIFHYFRPQQVVTIVVPKIQSLNEREAIYTLNVSAHSLCFPSYFVDHFNCFWILVGGSLCQKLRAFFPCRNRKISISKWNH